MDLTRRNFLVTAGAAVTELANLLALPEPVEPAPAAQMNCTTTLNPGGIVGVMCLNPGGIVGVMCLLFKDQLGRERHVRVQREIRLGYSQGYRTTNVGNNRYVEPYGKMHVLLQAQELVGAADSIESLHDLLRAQREVTLDLLYIESTTRLRYTLKLGQFILNISPIVPLRHGKATIDKLTIDSCEAFSANVIAGDALGDLSQYVNQE